MVFSHFSIALACCNRKSFRSISPTRPCNSVPPTNTSTKNFTFNQNSFPKNTNNGQYQSPNKSPMRNHVMIPFCGPTSGSPRSTRSDHFIESFGTLKKRMLSAPTLSTRKPNQTPKIRNGWKEKENEKKNEKSEQDEEWYLVKKITPGERNRIPRDDADELVLYDWNGNRIRNYRNRTPRLLPVSRTNSAEDEDLKIL